MCPWHQYDFGESLVRGQWGEVGKRADPEEDRSIGGRWFLPWRRSLSEVYQDSRKQWISCPSANVFHGVDVAEQNPCGRLLGREPAVSEGKGAERLRPGGDRSDGMRRLAPAFSSLFQTLRATLGAAIR